MKIVHEYLGPEYNQKKLNRILTLQRQNDIISLLLEGKDVKFIADYICEKYSIARSTATTYISEARAEIKERNKLEVNNLVSLHIGRYETIFSKLNELGAHSFAMKALQSKEKLMGFHKQGFHMRVTQGQITAVSLQNVRSEYNVMKLSPEKRKRMDELLLKAKRTNEQSSAPKIHQ